MGDMQAEIKAWIYTLTIVILFIGFLMGTWMVSAYGGMPEKDQDNIKLWNQQTNCKVLQCKQERIAGVIMDQSRGCARVKFLVGNVSRTEMSCDNTMHSYDIFHGNAQYFVELFEVKKIYTCWYQSEHSENVRLWARTPPAWHICHLTGLFLVIVGGIAM